MSETGTEYSESLLREVDSLQREVQGIQQMLGHVLQSVGHPVFVGKAALTEGIPDGAQIRIDDDIAGDRFIFSLEIPDGD